MVVHKIENATHRNISIESKGPTQCEPHVTPDAFQNGGSHASPPSGDPVSNQPRQRKEYRVEHARGAGVCQQRRPADRPPQRANDQGTASNQKHQREYGDARIEDLRLPYFCVSANLTTGRLYEHRTGSIADALRASVAIPGVMPPVFQKDGVLVDGAAINNLPVDVMQSHAPGFVIGCDVGADRNFGERRVNIFQVLMHAGMINSAASERAQRELADVLLKPPLPNIDLLNWQAFDRAIQAGYDYARAALDELPAIPRLAAPTRPGVRINSAAVELERKIAASIAAR